ncbi:transmembrane protein [Ceratobasidium sp. AG-Ba]|nr:transmembrane protein [Ceratobasidium sp. AG-Ba]
MRTFTRLFSFITLFLSLGFIAQALPSNGIVGPTGNGAKGPTARALAVRSYATPAAYNVNKPYGSTSYGSGSNNDNDPSSLDVVSMMHTLKLDLAPRVEALGAAADFDAAQVQISNIVALIQTAVVEIEHVNVEVTKSVAAEIARCFVDIIISIVSACGLLVGKLGATICISLFVQLDTCLCLFLLALNAGISGLLQIVVDLCLKLDVKVLTDLKLCNTQLLIGILNLTTKIQALIF